MVASMLQYLPLAGAFAGGMACAGILLWLTGGTAWLTARVVWLARSIKMVPPWTVVAVICLAIVGLVGALAQSIDFIQAMLILLLGSAALVAMAQVIDRLQRGESIELQSHWGGLGGAIGGWRLSPVTSLLLLALILTGSAIGVGVGGGKKGEQDSKINPPANAVKDAGKDVSKAAPKGAAGGQASEPPAKTETPPSKKD